MKLFKRVITISLALLIMLGSFNTFKVEVAAASGSGKLIHVVFDDSRSMYLNNETRWCQAKYALEVFAAMLGDNDIMNVYCLNREEILSVKGSSRSRVSDIHQMTSRYSGTPFGAVTKAGDALVRDSSDREKWLVILTDGQFDNVSKSTVQSTIDKYNSSGIKTVFLSIGGEAEQLDNKPDKNSYAYKTTSTSEILNGVTSIANQIFEHMVLPSSFIANNGAQRTLKFDIPVSEIVVFAQGENVSVGSLNYNGNEIRPTETLEVKHSGDVLPLNPSDTIPIDDTLHGVVARFVAGSSTPFESGEYTITVNGETAVEYYYRPGVIVNCELYQGDTIVPANSIGLPAGTYQVRMNFVHPSTGEVLNSQLLDSATFNMVATNNGHEQIINSTTGTITLEKGEVNIDATAKLPGNVVLNNKKTYSVLQSLKVDIIGNPGTFIQDQLIGNNKAQPIIVRIVDEETGEPITDIDPKNITFVVEDDKGKNSGITWEYVKNDDDTWSVIPKSTDGKMKNIKPGDRTIKINVTFTQGNRSGAGNLTFPINIAEYTGSQFSIEMSGPNEYDLNNRLAGDPMIATVYYTNPDTGVRELISEEMWKKLNLSDETIRGNGKKGRIGWNIKKGDTVGTYEIKPTYWMGLLSLFTSTGPHNLTLSGEVRSGEYNYSGDTVQLVNILPYTLLNLLIRILIFLAVALFIIGHIVKPRIKTRGRNFYPVCILMNGSLDKPVSAKRRINKEFMSVIIPFVPEKATVKSRSSQFGCNAGDIHIVATSSNQFQILSSLPYGSMKISGRRFKDDQELHKMIFNYGSFKLDSLDRNGMSTGRFQFMKPKEKNKRKKSSRSNSRSRTSNTRARRR